MRRNQRLLPVVSITMVLILLTLASCTGETNLTPVVQQTDQANQYLIQTAVAATATMQSYSATQAVIATATEQVRQTESAIAVTQTSQALMIEIEQLRRDAEAARLEEARISFFNTGMGIIFFVVTALFILLLAWLVYVVLRPHLNIGGRSTESVRHIVTMPNPSRPQLIEAAFNPDQPLTEVPAETVQRPPNQVHPRAYIPDIPAVAPWRKVAEEWHAAGSLPLGVGMDGLIQVDLSRHPHLLIAGSRQSQFELFALRPLAAAALATGWQVKLYNEEENRFEVFEGRQNFSLHTYGMNRMVQSTLAMRRLLNEARSRASALEEAQQPAPRSPRQLVIFHNLLPGADSPRWREEQAELWQLAEDAAYLGGQVGIHLLFTLIDPGYYAIHPRLRSHLTPVAFQVADAAASRVVLNRGGAERLYPRQFTANLYGGEVYGFAFAPDDKEIERYLDEEVLR